MLLVCCSITRPVKSSFAIADVAPCVTRTPFIERHDLHSHCTTKRQRRSKSIILSFFLNSKEYPVL